MQAIARIKSCVYVVYVMGFVALLLLPAVRVAAQSAVNGSITGTVTDASGALVGGVTVVVTNTDTGAVRTVKTGNDGIYIVPVLQSGHYQVLAGGGSFGKINRSNLTLTVGQTLTVDAMLPAASVSTQVVVTTAAPLLDTSKVEVSQTVNQKLISNLPTNGRRWDNFVLLTPNVVPDGPNGLVSFRGISGIYNNNMIDGTSNQIALFNEARGRSIGSPYVFSPDSIKEFESSASGYSAEFGQAPGGVINAITKSGSNEIHGDLFYYLRYPALNALDPIAKYTGRLNNQAFLLSPPVHQQQQFGGSVGGPIIKDKLFGFFTYDGFRKVNPILFYSSTSSATVNGFACPAAISVTQCNNAKAFIIGQNGSFPRTGIQDIFFPKLDYQLNEKNHLSASFLFANFRQPNGYITTPTVANSANSTNGRNDFHERYIVANWETVLSSAMVNALHFQWSRDLEVSGVNGPGPAFTIGSSFLSYGESLALPRPAFPDEHRIQVFDTFTYVHGKHTIKAGIDMNFIHEHVANLFQGNGNYTYAAFAGQTQTGNAGAFFNWVQDIYGVNGGQHYTQFTQVNDPITHAGIDDFWGKNLAGFAQDDWKLKRNLLLSFGVRYDLQLVPQPTRPYTNSYNGAPSPLGNSVTSSIHINTKMIQPRIGFAWTPLKSTTVSGGYGIFYGLTPYSIYYNERVTNGVFQQQYTVKNGAITAAPGSETGISVAYPAGAPDNTGVLFLPPGPALAAPFPGAVTPTVNGSAGLTPLSFRGMDPNYTNPYTHSWDLSVQQVLPFKSTITVAYVGTRGMRLPYSTDANLPTTTLTKTYDVIDTSGNTTSTVTVPFYSSSLARPSPNDGVILVAHSGINTWYNSMATTISKPFDHGLELLLNYTWSKAIDGGQVSGVNAAFNGTDVILDPYNFKGPGGLNQYSRSDLDMRGRFVGSIVYSPVLSIGPSYIRMAANGWTISGTATEQTGQPLTAMMSVSPAAATTIDGGVTGGEVNLNAASAAGRAPQIARNGIPGPGIRNVDARIGRDFKLHQNMKFEVFAEAFNVANRQEIQAQNLNAFTLTCTGTHTNACIAPVAPSATPFGTPTSTSGILYGPRQLQFAAKLTF